MKRLLTSFALVALMCPSLSFAASSEGNCTSSAVATRATRSAFRNAVAGSYRYSPPKNNRLLPPRSAGTALTIRRFWFLLRGTKKPPREIPRGLIKLTS